MRKEKLFLVLILFLFVCIFSFPEGRQEKEKAIAGEKKVTLEIWGWAQAQKPLWDKFAQDFAKEYPGITVTIRIIPRANWASTLSAALISGKGPDLFSTNSGEEMINHIENGDFVNLAPLMDLEWKKSFYKSTLNIITVRKQIVTIPFATNNLQVLYDKVFFEKHGLSFPKTLDQFNTIASKIKALGRIPLIVQLNDKDSAAWIFLVMMGGIDPDLLLKANSGEQYQLFKDPKFQTAFENFKRYLVDPEFIQNGATGMGYNELNVLFAQEKKGAMYFQGTWVTRAMRKLDDNYYHTLDLAPFPAAEENNLPPIPSGIAVNQGIWSGSKHKEEALKWLRWISFNKTQVFVEKVGLCPAGHAISDEMVDKIAAETNNHLLKKWVRGQKGLSGRNIDKLLFNTKIAQVVFTSMQGIALGKITPQKAYEEMIKALSKK